MSEQESFLSSLGWNDFFQASFDELTSAKSASKGVGFAPARIVGQGKGHYQLQVGPQKTIEAAITNQFHKAVTEPSEFPTVGDWVTYLPGTSGQQAAIHHLLNRWSLIQRRKLGGRQPIQLIAANVDFLLIVTSLNEDFDLERLGRYVALGRDSGCKVAVLLTKADLCDDPEEYIEQVSSEFEQLEVFAISIENADSLKPIEKFFAPGKTAVLVGSSGVGKSTLTNYLLGSETQKTQSVSAESRGRHTTTARNLRFTRFGGLVIDTPGMQEISAVDQPEEIENEFADVEDLMLSCKFTSCQHVSEPGCAIKDALKTRRLSTARWATYLAARAAASRPQKNRSR